MSDKSEIDNLFVDNHENLLNVCKLPAENRLALSCRGHKSKGSRTQHLNRKNNNTKHTSRSPQIYIIPCSDSPLPRVTITSHQSLRGKQCPDWYADRWGHHDNTKTRWWLNGEWDGARFSLLQAATEPLAGFMCWSLVLRGLSALFNSC